MNFHMSSNLWHEDLQKWKEEGVFTAVPYFVSHMVLQLLSPSPSLNRLWFPQWSRCIHLFHENKHQRHSGSQIKVFQGKVLPEICASMDFRFANQVFLLRRSAPIAPHCVRTQTQPESSGETFCLPSKSLITFTQSLSLSSTRKHSVIPNVPTLLIFTHSVISHSPRSGIVC